MQDTTDTPKPDEAGIAILELALTLPVLLLVIVGAVTFGVILTVDHSLSAAASEGARAAVGAATEPEARAAATAAATDQLGALGSFAADAVVAVAPPVDCPSPAGARCITVQVSYPWASNPIIPDLMGLVTPDELSAASTIQLTEWATS